MACPLNARFAVGRVNVDRLLSRSACYGGTRCIPDLQLEVYTSIDRFPDLQLEEYIACYGGTRAGEGVRRLGGSGKEAEQEVQEQDVY